MAVGFLLGPGLALSALGQQTKVKPVIRTAVVDKHGKFVGMTVGGYGGLGTDSPAGKGIIFKSPDGNTCKKLTIDDSGNPVWTTVSCP